MVSPVYSAIRSCTACSLRATCAGPVPGDGPMPARIMLVGEAPGQNEDKTGKPFQGQAGKYLDYLLESINLPREFCYITNLTKCRPPNNRDPEPEEVEACAPRWLDMEVSIVNPSIIVALGAYAARFLLGSNEFTMEHGHGIPVDKGDCIILPVYHPAAGLHQSRLMRFVQDDFAVLGRLVAGEPPENFIPVDQYPNPVYEEVTNERDARDLLARPLYALDTETITGPDGRPELWSIQVSTMEGTGWFIPIGERGVRDSFGIPQRGEATTHLIPSTSQVIVHNYLYDAQFINIPNPLDSMVAAYLLQLPMGLKELAYRLCGMEMHSYEEYVRPYRRQKALSYLYRATSYMQDISVPANKKAKNPKKFKRSIVGWPDPPEIKDWEWSNKEGRLMEVVKHPHDINSKILSRIRASIQDPGYQPYEKWYDVDSREREMVEGAKREDAVFYSTRDPDATIRVWNVLEPMLKERGLWEVFLTEMGEL